MIYSWAQSCETSLRPRGRAPCGSANPRSVLIRDKSFHERGPKAGNRSWNSSALELLKSVEMSMAVEEHSETTQAGADCIHAPPNLEIRFTPVYAWMTIGFGVIFFLLGFFIALLGHHRNLGFGFVICLISVPAVIGANYWRKHLHIVAQMTPGQLVLRRDGSIDWDNIAAIENKEIRSSYHGARGRSEFVCIRLKNKPAPKNRWDSFFLKAKHAITGYDVIVPANDMSCTADWFIAECRKRMAAMNVSGSAH